MNKTASHNQKITQFNMLKVPVFKNSSLNTGKRSVYPKLREGARFTFKPKVS